MTLSSKDFWQTYGAELAPVCTFLDRLGAPSGEVEDLAHDTFLIAFQKLGTFDPRRPIRPWLFGIAARVARARGQRAHVSREVFADTSQVRDAAAPADERLAMHQLERQLRRMLLELDEEQRLVFVMHDIESQSMPEVAEAAGIPLNTAYSRLRRARLKLNDAFAALRAQEVT